MQFVLLLDVDVRFLPLLLMPTHRLRFFTIGCRGKELDLSVKMKHETGENYVMKNFMIYTSHQI